MSESKPTRRGISAHEFLLGLRAGTWLARVVPYVLLGFVLGLLCGCGTANNYRLPPYEVKRQELTCDRNTHNLPAGLVCVCTSHNGWDFDCEVARVR